jgi:hypothetical protein
LKTYYQIEIRKMSKDSVIKKKGISYLKFYPNNPLPQETVCSLKGPKFKGEYALKSLGI